MPKLQKVLRWLNLATVAILIGSGLVLFLLRITWVVVILLTLCYFYRRGRPLSGVMGTARWATPADIPELMRNEGGLPIGVMAGRVGKAEAAIGLLDSTIPDEEANQAFQSSFERHSPGHPVFLNTVIHTLICASSGAGKSVSLAVPFLLSCRHSAVILDVKGELYRATYSTRRRYGQVAVIDPFGLVGGKDTFNVLDIDPESPYALDDARELGEALVLKTQGSSQDPYWNSAATQVLAAFLALYVSEAKGEYKSLQHVLNSLSSDELFKRGINSMRVSKAFGGLLERYGNQLAGIHQKQLASVKAIVHENLGFLSSTAVAAVTGHVSTFDPRLLRRGVLSIFVVVPPERVEALSGYLRLLMTAFARAAIREGMDRCGKVTFLLDECAYLRNLGALSTILQIGRAYQTHLQMYFQSLGQLQAAWPDGGEKLVLGNTCHVHAGTNDYADAEAISKQCGNSTEVQESGGTGVSRSNQSNQNGSVTYSASDNWSLTSTPLLRPEQVLTLPPRTAITFMPNTPPIITRLVPWWAQNTGSYSRAKVARHSVARFFCAVGLFTLSTLFVKEVMQWPNSHPIPVRPNPNHQSPARPTKASSKSSGAAPSGRSPGASTTAR